MDDFVLVPSLICLFLIMRGRMSTALLSVYLPTLFLLPVRVYDTPPSSSGTGISEICVIPLGIVGIIRLIAERLPETHGLSGDFVPHQPFHLGSAA